MSSFDTRPAYNAEASHFTAKIKAGLYKWTAELDWKEANKFKDPLSFNAQARTTGKYAGAKVIHAASEEALRAQLRHINPSVKFIAVTNKKTALGTSISKLSDSDATMLEGMRVDPDVSDIVYNRACRQFGATPEKRPDFTVVPAVVEKSPYTAKETGELNHAFLRLFLDKKHPELKENNHEHYNTQVLLNWHKDSGLNILTMASLDRAFEECNALQFFRSAQSGVRTRGQSDNLVRSYSFERIQEYRRPAEPEQPEQPPAPGSPEEAADRRRVMKLATEHVQHLHPLWKPSSGEFQRELLKTVKEFAISSNLKLGVGKIAHF
jgi:hypothetical protein